MARPRKEPGEVTSETILAELERFDVTNTDPEKEESTYMRDIWAHRVESESFVRAFAWARKRGNGLKGCLIYADAHELNHEDSDEPVAIRD
jgi:hypothetical protein